MDRRLLRAPRHAGPLHLAACIAVALARPPAQSPGPAAPDLEARVDALVAERLAAPEATGFSVAVARRGEIVLAKGYGLAEVEFDNAANAETCFRIGSVTKQFTAALVMRLVEEQELALDDPLSRFLPDFPLQGRTVTIRQLLNHTSGIPSYTDAGAEWEKANPLELSHGELLAFVRGKPFDFEPGAAFRYNNTGYYLLGMVLEKAHGKPYAQIVHDELAAPLGLSRTRYDSNRDVIANRAQGYAIEGGRRVHDALLGTSQPGAAGALLSTAADLVRWTMALAGGKVVGAASFAQMTAPTVLPDGRDTGYGFGLIVGKVAGEHAVLHGGGIHGFNSMLLWLREHDLHVAVLSNSERASSDKLARAIVRAALDKPAVAARNVATTPELRRQLAGDFHFADLGMDLRVEIAGERLRVRGQREGQQAFDLLWQGPDGGGLEFRAAFDHEVVLVFAADGRAVTLHQGGGVFAGERR